MWPNSILSLAKTHENTLGICNKAPKELSDCDKQDCLVWWTSNPSIMFGRKQALLITCRVASQKKLHAMGLFFISRAWVEGKLNTAKYRENLNENPVQNIQNLRLGRRITFQPDNDPKHTARVAYRQLCECPWVAHSTLNSTYHFFFFLFKTFPKALTIWWTILILTFVDC